MCRRTGSPGRERGPDSDPGRLELWAVLRRPLVAAAVAHGAALWLAGGQQQGAGRLAEPAALVALCVGGLTWRPCTAHPLRLGHWEGTSGLQRCAGLATCAGLLAAHSVWLMVLNWALCWLLLLLVAPLVALRAEVACSRLGGRAGRAALAFWRLAAAAAWSSAGACFLGLCLHAGVRCPERMTLVRVWPWLAASCVPAWLQL